MAEHRHAELLRIAADNKDVLFECDGISSHHPIFSVLARATYNWRVATPPKKMVTKWMWANTSDRVSKYLMTENEARQGRFTIKLEWSATEMEE